MSSAVSSLGKPRGLPQGWIITRDRSYARCSYAAWHYLETRVRVIRLIRSVTGVRRGVASPYAYRCRLAASNEIECGQRAVAAIADEIDRKGAESVAAVLMEPQCGHQWHRGSRKNYWAGFT